MVWLAEECGGSCVLQVKAMLLLVNGEDGLTAGILVLLLGVARGEPVLLILIAGMVM